MALHRGATFLPFDHFQRHHLVKEECAIVTEKAAALNNPKVIS
jgi:hypothetical protein